MKLKIAQTLSYILDSRRLTIKEISKATGVPMSSISGWKKDNRSPHAEQAAKVARHLGVTVHYLLFGEEDHEEPLQKILKEDFFSGTFEITVKKVKLKENK